MSSPADKSASLAEKRTGEIPDWPSRRHTELELAQKYGVEPVPKHSPQLDRSAAFQSDTANGTRQHHNNNHNKSKNLAGDYMSFKPQPSDNKENIRGSENQVSKAADKSSVHRFEGSQSAFVKKNRDKSVRGKNDEQETNPFMLTRNDSEVSGFSRVNHDGKASRPISRSNSLLQRDVPPAPEEGVGEKDLLKIKAEQEDRTFEVRRRRVLTDVLSKLDHFRTNGVSRQRTKEYLLKRYRDKLHYPFAAERDILTLQVLIEVLYEELDTQLKTNEKDRLWVEMHKSDVNNLSDKDKTAKIQQLQKEIRGLEEQMRQMKQNNEQEAREASKKAWMEAESKQIAQDKEILHLQTIISRLRGDRDLFDKYWDTLCLLFADLDEWILQQAVESQDERLEPLRERVQRAGQFARWAKDYTLSGDERKFFEDREWIRRQELEKKEWALIMEFKDLGPRKQAPPSPPKDRDFDSQPPSPPTITLKIPSRLHKSILTQPTIPPLRLQPSYSPHSRDPTSMSPPRTSSPKRGQATDRDSPAHNIRSLVSSPRTSKGRPSTHQEDFRPKRTIATVEFGSEHTRNPKHPKPQKPQPAAEPIYHSLVSAASAEEFSLRMGALSRDDLLKLCGELGDTIHMLRLERGKLCDKLFEAIEKLKARLFDCCAIIEAMGKISSGMLGEFWAKRGVQLVNDLLSGVAMSRESPAMGTPSNRKEPLSAFKVTTPLKSQVSVNESRTPSPNSKLPTDIFDYGEAIANAEWVRELLGLQQQRQDPLSPNKHKDEHHRASRAHREENDTPVRVADVRLTSGKKSIAVDDRQVNVFIRLESEQKAKPRAVSEEQKWTRHEGGSPGKQRPDDEAVKRALESPIRSQLEVLLIENASLKASVDRLKKLVENRVIGQNANIRGQSRDLRETAQPPAPSSETLQLLATQAIVIEKLLSQMN